MKPFEQLNKMTAAQKALETVIGRNSALTMAQEIAKGIQIPESISAYGGAYAMIREMQDSVKYKPDISVAALISGINPLLDWYQNNPLKNQVDGILSNHAILSHTLSGITASFSTPYVKPLSAMEVAIRGISTDFLRHVPFENFEIAEEEYNAVEDITEAIATQSETLNVAAEDYVTVEIFEEYQTKLFRELELIRSKSTSDKIKALITQLMQTISFAVMIFTLYSDSNKMSNRELSETFEQRFETYQNQTDVKLDSILGVLTHQRIARTDVNLRVANKKRAAKKGVVKKGQAVSVIENLHKHLLIYFIDIETGEPKSGYVYKKYFDKLK